MRNPWEEDDIIVYCDCCGKPIDTDYVNILDGTAYCDDCKADNCEKDEDGDLIDDDWSSMEVGEYFQRQKEKEYDAYCDRACDEWRDRQFAY